VALVEADGPERTAFLAAGPEPLAQTTDGVIGGGGPPGWWTRFGTCTVALLAGRGQRTALRSSVRAPRGFAVDQA